MLKLTYEDAKGNRGNTIIPDCTDDELVDDFVSAIQDLSDAQILQARMFTWVPFAGTLGTGMYDAIAQHITARFLVTGSGGTIVGTENLKVPTPKVANVEDADKGKGKKRWKAATLATFVTAVKTLVGGTNVYTPKSGYLFETKSKPK